MPERTNPSLSEILNTFRKSMTKTAGEGEMADPAAADPSMADPAQASPMQEHPEGRDCPECVPETGVNELAQAAQNLDEAKACADMAEDQVVDAASALKSIADDFIGERTETISKEAQLFGQLFAASCMEQMNKTAKLREREAQAYDLASNAISESGMNKVAAEQISAVYDEAWRTSMAKLAGFESAEDMEEAAGQELGPEEIAAILAAAQDGQLCDCGPGESCELCDGENDEASELAALIAEDAEAGDSDLTDEEVQALAAQLADAQEGDDADPEAVAAAANLISEAREGKIGDELDKAANLAYDATTESLLGGRLQKTASDAYATAADVVWGNRFEKTAAEAYALTAQALGF